MNQPSESPLLSPDEGPPVRVYNARGQGDVVLVCEHASRFIPAALGNLGLDPDSESSHAAWDIGAMELALELMAELDAPLIAGRVSRLVYDCNRPPTARDAVPSRSERFAVPGNEGLSAQERERRTAEIYTPFRTTLAEFMKRRPETGALVTVHSFTPVFNGVPRETEVGFLHDRDATLAVSLLTAAEGRFPYRAALNEPYSAADGVTHTLKEHGTNAGLPNVMIEVRNDLVDTPAGIRRMGAALAGLISRDKAWAATSHQRAGTC